MTDTFRKNCGIISHWQQVKVEKIKEKAEELEAIINLKENMSDFRMRKALEKANQVDLRHTTIAQTNLEQAVMWAVKGFTVTEKED